MAERTTASTNMTTMDSNPDILRNRSTITCSWPLPRRTPYPLKENQVRIICPHGLALESGLQRLFGISGYFVSLPPSPHKPNTAKAPGTAGFGEVHGLAEGSQEKEWWWTQSGANPSLADFPDKQGIYREILKF